MSFNKLALICVLGLVAACGASEPEAVIGKPPVEMTTQGSRGQSLSTHPKEDAAAERPQFPEPILTRDGWPYNDEGNSFRVSWDSGPEQVPLYAEPSLNSAILAHGTFTREHPIRWNQTAVAVFRPSTYRVKSQVLVEGFVFDDGYRTGDGYSETLSPGEVVRLYHYATEGTCLMGVRKVMVEIICPDPEHYAGNFQGNSTAAQFQPAQSTWWLFVNSNTGSGWMPLDDRVIIDIE